MTPFLVLSVAGAMFWGLEAAQSPSTWSILATVGCGGAALFFLRTVGASIRGGTEVRLVPLFSERVGHDRSTFSSGVRIAADFVELEAAAVLAGLPPLSSYRAGPRWYGTPPEWSAPADCLPTVRELSRGAIARGKGTLAEELRLLEAALTRAGEKGVRFCFHLRTRDDLISPVEMDQLSGSYW